MGNDTICISCGNPIDETFKTIRRRFEKKTDADWDSDWDGMCFDCVMGHYDWLSEVGYDATEGDYY